MYDQTDAGKKKVMECQHFGVTQRLFPGFIWLCGLFWASKEVFLTFPNHFTLLAPLSMCTHIHPSSKHMQMSIADRVLEGDRTCVALWMGTGIVTKQARDNLPKKSPCLFTFHQHYPEKRVFLSLPLSPNILFIFSSGLLLMPSLDSGHSGYYTDSGRAVSLPPRDTSSGPSALNPLGNGKQEETIEELYMFIGCLLSISYYIKWLLCSTCLISPFYRLRTWSPKWVGAMAWGQPK